MESRHAYKLQDFCLLQVVSNEAERLSQQLEMSSDTYYLTEAVFET